MATILGSSSSQQLNSRLTWSYFTGEQQELRWTGPKAALDTIYASAITTGASSYDVVEYDPGRGRGDLTIRTVADGEAIYELFANELRRPLALAPYFSDLTEAQIAQVDRVFMSGDYPTPTESGFADKQLAYYTLLLRGTDEYLESAYVLRETKIVSRRSALSAPYTGVNTVQTPPTTYAANTLLSTLPDGEWLKKAPTVTLIGNRRWQISQEWWWAVKWSLALYAGTGTP